MPKKKLEFKPITLHVDVGEYGKIYCPQCDFVFIHVVKTTSTLEDMDAFRLSITKPIDTTVKPKSLIELIHEVSLRGSRDYSIALHYKCESGCKGIIRFRHSKGDTYLEHAVIKSKEELK